MRAKTMGRSFFLLHFFFAICFTAALFFASFLASSEVIGRRMPEKARHFFHFDRFAVESEAVYQHENAPSVSLIVDDAGENLDLLQGLLSIPIPVTVSIIPGAPYDRQSAEWARVHGVEVMVHLPMEPVSYPEKDPGPYALLSAMDRRQLVDRTAQLLERIPYAVGVNNHMGSRLTTERHAMNIVMNVVAREGLFFIDSRTTYATVAYQVAQQKGIPSGERTLFLDDPMDSEGILARFDELVQAARDNGNAIGICHFKPGTLSALRSIDPARYSDIRFTFASESVR